ncbi:MAG: acyl-CoA reductase [Bacteroidia bacterium]|nr:MAG: acyl-CoA reductase [Bacteroidia bacterium]
MTPEAKFLYQEATRCNLENPWFTPREIARALDALSRMLAQSKMERWLEKYPGLGERKVFRKNVAVIMAGNIPLVGFHDLLCVIMSGHRFTGKVSSQDTILPAAVAKLLVKLEPALAERLFLTDRLPEDADAVIATGSDNTARYFSYHYGDKPHIIRKNRNACAIISGNESKAELAALGTDVFSYYGMGCRSVSQLLVPESYDLSRLAEEWKPFRYVTDNVKYLHNIRYQKATYLAGNTPCTDEGFFLLRRSEQIASPPGVLHYMFYDDHGKVRGHLENNRDMIQCVLAQPDSSLPFSQIIPFGRSQYPEIDDYADGVDVVAFLTSEL